MTATTSSVPTVGAPEPGTSEIPLSLTSVTKHFKRPGGSVVPAIDGVDLEVQPGEFVVLLGPSGCGKTTLLRSIAGLERPDSGYIASHGQPLYDSAQSVDIAPERRGLGMVFQSYALFPHMSVAGNVGYPMRHGRRHGRKGSKADVREAVLKACSMVGIEELVDQFPNQISGGQQQRVALARALVDGRDVILFDEPLSNVDARVREHLRSELKIMHEDLGFTAVYVTHDQIEAMELADRIVVMEKGKIAQQGSPEEIYGAPRTQYVARFLGITNDVSAEVLSAMSSQVELKTSIGMIMCHDPGDAASGDRVRVVMRPENLSLGGPHQPPNRWPATVVSRSFLGAYTEYIVRLEGEHTAVVRGPKGLGDTGDRVTVSIDPKDVRVVLADAPERGR